MSKIKAADANGNKLIIKKRGEDNHRTFSIRIKKDLIEQIDDMAGKSRRNRNEIISLLLEYGIKNVKI